MSEVRRSNGDGNMRKSICTASLVAERSKVGINLGRNENQVKVEARKCLSVGHGARQTRPGLDLMQNKSDYTTRPKDACVLPD